MKNGMDYVADWLIWPNGMLLETIDILTNYDGNRTLVYKVGGEYHRIGA